jgi:hypothetical protein
MPKDIASWRPVLLLLKPSLPPYARRLLARRWTARATAIAEKVERLVVRGRALSAAAQQIASDDTAEPEDETPRIED